MLSQEIYSAVAFAFLIGLGCLSNYLIHRISVKVLTEESEVLLPESFIATRSYKDLQVLTGFGPKATGSDANEIQTVNFLLTRANEIKSSYGNVSEITVDHQLVSGVHFVSAHYRNLQNIVVKLHGESDKALMVNCHFDSEAGSYGAGDDGVNCCTMLEILRVLAKSGRKNKFSIIFLFNGSEEGNLEGIQASHGFITQHKWAPDVKAFVNLEAQGIGGRELLFRSGPKHDWLIKKYRQSVPKRFGQVMAEEMFETNVLNSGTDFESFRDDGSVPGLDISYCNGGWKYHTKFDHIRYVTTDSIQHTGDNILELVKMLANSDELENPPVGSPAVYFDLWGFVFISYTAAVGRIINICVSILAVVIPFLVQTKLKLKNCGIILKETLASFLTFIVSTILSMAACFLMGLIMNSADNAMFWHNATILSLGVYSTLALIVQIAVHHASDLILKKCSSKSSKAHDKYDEKRRIQARLNGINLFWAVLTLVVTGFGFRFAYISMVMLVISLITNLLIYVCRLALPEPRLHSWIFVHFSCHAFSFLWTSYLFLLLWRVFIPITEKTYNANPETTIGLLSGFMTVLTLSYFIPLTSLVKSRAILYATLIGAFIVSVILSFTSAGFPYSGSLAEPRVQRHYVTHTKRTFFDVDGGVRFSDLGFYIKENERNTKRTLDKFLNPESLLLKDNDEMCATEAFCGFPSYNTTNAFWMKSNEAPLIAKSTLELKAKTENGNSVELSFDLVGTFLTILFIAPEAGVEIASTSVGFSQYEWVEGRTAHYLKITNGKASSDPFSFTVTMQKSAEALNLLKVTVTSIDMHFDKSPPMPEFQKLLESFPDFTFVQSHQADVSSYTFK